MILPFLKSAEVVVAYGAENLLLGLQSDAVGHQALLLPGLSSSSIIFIFLFPVTLEPSS